MRSNRGTRRTIAATTIVVALGWTPAAVADPDVSQCRSAAFRAAHQQFCDANRLGRPAPAEPSGPPGSIPGSGGSGGAGGGGLLGLVHRLTGGLL